MDKDDLDRMNDLEDTIDSLRASCAALLAREKELEDAAQTWKNAWNAACNDISKLQSRLALLEKVAEAASKYMVSFDSPMVLVHDEMTLLENIRAALDALKEGK